MYKRVFLLILDSLGIGATKDADKYGDGLANSLLNTIKETNIELPNFKSLGLFKILDDENYRTAGFYTKASPKNKMKCSVINHYEMMCSPCTKEYQKLYIEKLNKDLVNNIAADINRRIIFAKEKNEKEIIEKYGVKHLKTGDVILSYDYYNITLYAHEAVIPLKELTKISKMIMENLVSNKYFINKIISKNFKGKPDSFIMCKESLVLPFLNKEETILSKLKKEGYKVITIGKSSKIFSNNEITNICMTNNDLESIKKLIQSSQFNFTGLCITNLSELNYCGHSRDIKNYSKILKNFDNIIPLIIKQLKKDDLLIITSDQGNDPTFSGNDHTREKVPVLMFSLNNKKSNELDNMETLADIGATIADNFGIRVKYGKSVLEKIK